MSAELEELRRMAQRERQLAWQHARLLPARAGDVASGFARAHPFWTMGGAAVLAMGLLVRKRRSSGGSSGSTSWLMALSAVGARLLPEILRFVGLTHREGRDDCELERARSDGSAAGGDGSGR